MTQVSELLPCPFCGDSANLEHWGSEVSILCSNCNVRSAPFFAENEAQAVAAWNTRAKDIPQGDEVERIKRILDIRYGDFQRNAKVAEEIAALVRSKLPIDRERVARAIAVAAGDDPDLPSLSQHTLLMRGEGAKIWEEWLPEADAAITAIGSQSIEGERG